MSSDTSEQALETLIVSELTGRSLDDVAHGDSHDATASYGAGCYVEGSPTDFDREHVIDLAKLTQFLEATQPNKAAALSLHDASPTRTQFLHRLDSELAKRGVVDVLRNGIQHGNINQLSLFYGTPSPGNVKAEELHRKNIFSVTRQLRYSRDETQNALDLCLLINGLPVATFELKNSLTKQTAADAVEQYKRDRNPKEPLFRFGRCLVHFAVDDAEAQMCTHLRGKDSWFLPFNKGWKDGAGNPPNPNGLKTDYLWKEVLTRDGLTDIIENYAQIVVEKDDKGRKKPPKQIFPRFHQRDVVRKLLADVRDKGVGKRYLIQHSTGSGKSNSIAWLAHQLIAVRNSGDELFDSIIVVTDRRILDKQIQNTIKQFMQVKAVIGAVTGDSASKTKQFTHFLNSGKKIIITTIQTFPFVLQEVGGEHQGKRFAIIIDEAHSSQGGKASAAMNEALGDPEDTVNNELERLAKVRRMLSNASYFAFTATPKNKTLEIFGEPVAAGDAESVGVQQTPGGARKPFHSYTMKQAIQERFIMDVLESYTPINSYYNLVKTIEDDPEFDKKKANRKLRRYVEAHDHAIRVKAEIMVDHFHRKVIGRRKMNGEARAMVVCNGINQAISYYHAIAAYLKQIRSPYEAIVAFSGEKERDGETVTEASINGFPSRLIPERFRENPYRLLVVADKFQTGYDEPLLHTMYVDKPLAGIKAVQTLSRLNRADPRKRDTFVLDFVNDADTIETAFSTYYRTTVLSQETDPNRLHDLRHALDAHQVYAQDQMDEFVALYLGNADRDTLDPILDACVAHYLEELDEDEQIDFKHNSKTFTRTYEFLASILPFTNAEWEKLCIFLNFLIPKLPAPKDEDLSKGILEAVDMESYRAEVQTTMNIALEDSDGEVAPIPTGVGVRKPEPELDRLSNILKTFNEQWGTQFSDSDKVAKDIRDYIIPKVKENTAYQNAMKHSDKAAARLEHDEAVKQAVVDMLSNNTELYKLFNDNSGFRQWLTGSIFAMTYEPRRTV
ncbi:MAG: type I restriction endonuclease subunit R [Candidatus Pacebacteria bacterium]|nr:type I restriction endonuclease subunit R [Candidatus Paceibacterota bacterium]